jgi:dUTPase
MDGNLYGSSYTIGKGERFAQMRLIEVPVVNWLQVKSIGDFQSDHGEGFGSTGMK